ncbi:MAG: phosphatidate cytidylyltransferase [Acidobacteriota bacterium]|nr:phosphatidate cytidylyltransferase [Acidobacteriota bacterium]
MNRLLTAIALLAVAFYLIFWAPDFIFLGAAILMGLLCYREYSDLVAGHGIKRPGLYGIAAGLLLFFLPQYVLTGITLLVIVALITALRVENLRDVLPQVACAVLGAFYTFAPWRFSADLRAVSIHLLFFALALNWAGDSIAYYVGRRFGKHRLAPIVSPKKSWEGAIASVMGSVLFGVLYLGYFLRNLPVWQVVTMAVVANIAGQFGDLAESGIKRGAGVKDSGDLLPGHGGMLDRVDSSLFALPVVYFIYTTFHQLIK